MPVSLQEILDSTRQSLPALRARRAALERDVLLDRVPRPSFRAALRRSHVAVIAEVKRRSPSAGSIREDLDPADRAALYAAHGAAAVSILTDARYFGGSVQDLRLAAQRCALPLLRKDFILEEVQVLEARAAGASAVLLIARVLSQARLDQLLHFAAELGLDALVEVHTRAELAIAVEVGASVIGVNSRDLDTFAVDVDAAWQLIGQVPQDRIAVAESGLVKEADVARVAATGVDAVLIGTALSASGSPEALLDQLTAVPRRGR
jgi:indole-3-glycerol phosphate synthase